MRVGFVALWLVAWGAGCTCSATATGGGQPDTDSDTGTDADVDTDADSDSDTGTGSDTGSDPCAGAGAACYDGPDGTRGVGVCVDGALVCEADALVCRDWIGPSEEECDREDDDCDGVVDGPSADGLAPCITEGLGVCRVGETRCIDSVETCVTPEPAEETCANLGFDDDCDGTADDGIVGRGDVCDTGLDGICADGVQDCDGGVLVCGIVVDVGERDETCANGGDEDCDGEIDEVGCLDTGCADGEREAFLDDVEYPDVAGCGGGWDVPGVYTWAAPACARGAGDDSADPDGAGCNVEDLCSAGWHVCTGPSDVTASSPDGCAGAADGAGSFWITRMSGPGCLQCATGATAGCTGVSCGATCAANAETTNDLFGCGTLGGATAASCSPLDRTSGDQCATLGAPWSCPDAGGDDEALVVVKNGSDKGGVMCCRD